MMSSRVMLLGLGSVLSLCLEGTAVCADRSGRQPAGAVNVKEFSELATDNDWSGAIQAAIDHVNADNGFERGATVYFPPEIYRVGKTVVLGRDRAHHGTRLSGYGAVLVGTKALDAQPLDYEERKKAFTEASNRFALLALPGELDFEGKNVGKAILELWRPPSQGAPNVLKPSTYEGASFVLEGLTFHREARTTGVGVKIPAEHVPKNVTFRDVAVHNQYVGVHINHSYQIRFESCIFRGNRIALWGRNHFNSVSIVNSTFRRSHHHGVIIGPNAGTWGSSVTHLAGNIFEANKGYGILNAGGNQVTVIGNYFEANGNAVGVLTPYGHTTIDTNLFWGYYGHGWKINKLGDTVVSNQAHIVVKSQNIVARANRYHGGSPFLIFGLSGVNTFDALPVVADGVELPAGTKAAMSSGLGVYVYDSAMGTFEPREFAIQTDQQRDEAEKAELRARVGEARKKLKEAKDVYKRVQAQLDIGRAYQSFGQSDRARAEYEKAFKYPAADQLHLRAAIQTTIADSFMEAEDYSRAAGAYAKAQAIGPGGWRKAHVEKNLKLARELAEKDAAAGKVTCNVCAHVYDPAAGDPTQNVKAGTAFDALPKAWKCPACGTVKSKFRKN